MTSSREALLTVQSPVATAWNRSSVLQQKLFVEDSNWTSYRHPFSDRTTWVASSPRGTRYGYTADVETGTRIAIEVVESDALVRLTWTFEPMKKRRTHLWQHVEAIGLRNSRRRTLRDQIHQSGIEAMQEFQRRTRTASDAPCRTECAPMLRRSTAPLPRTGSSKAQLGAADRGEEVETSERTTGDRSTVDGERERRSSASTRPSSMEADTGASLSTTHSQTPSPSESASSSTRVFLVDDHPAVRKALRDRLESTFDMEVCGNASAADEALHHIERLDPDVAVVGTPLADADGLDLVRTIRAQCPGTQLVVFALYDENAHAEQALRAGALGYVTKGESVTTLIDAIRAVRRRDVFLSSRLSDRILSRMVWGEVATDRSPINGATAREKMSRKARAA